MPCYGNLVDSVLSCVPYFEGEADTALPSLPENSMTKANDRKVHRAGLTAKKCRRGTVYTDPVTGESLYDGNRSSKSYHKEREIESFLRRRERGGVG